MARYFTTEVKNYPAKDEIFKIPLIFQSYIHFMIKLLTAVTLRKECIGPKIV